MIALVAYAERADSGNPDLWLALVCVVFVGIACTLAFVPFAMVRLRNPARKGNVLLAAILWALISAGSGIYLAQSRISWRREYDLRVQSGYYDPQDLTDFPAIPWRFGA